MHVNYGAAMICPNGHGPKPGSFCDQCGVTLVAPAQNSMEPFEIFGNDPCPGCGYELDHNHQQYCPDCGHKLTWLCR